MRLNLPPAPMSAKTRWIAAPREVSVQPATKWRAKTTTHMDADCMADCVGDSSSEWCPLMGAGICCSKWASDTACGSNAEAGAAIACVVEIILCSIDDLPYFNNSRDALSSGSEAPVKKGFIFNGKGCRRIHSGASGYDGNASLTTPSFFLLWPSFYR